MSTKRLVSFVGTSQYGKTCYSFGAKEVKTRYVAYALARLHGVSEVRLLATDKAWETHGNGITGAFAEYWPGGPEPARDAIPDGRTEAELWEQFQVLNQAVGTGDPDTVVIDITHGFRAQPFFAAAALALMRSSGLLRAEVEVVYGEYRKEEAFSPVWDLTPFVDLLDWSHGIGLFVQTGHAGPLLEVLKRRDSGIRREIARKGGHKFPGSAGFAAALERFADDLATVRIPQLITGYEQEDRNKGGAVSSSQALLHALKGTRGELEQHIPPLATILDELERVVKPLPQRSLFGDSGLAAMQALARHYMALERYPESAIVVREALISRIAAEPTAVEVNSPGFDDGERHDLDVLWSREYRTESKTVSGVRNDIEHGGFRKQPVNGKSLKKRVNNLFDTLEGLKCAPKTPKAAKQTGGGTIWFVSRHPGARDWAAEEGIAVDKLVDHLEVDQIAPGDRVIGSLPVNLAAEVCARGGRYLHLSLDLPQELRGRDLTAEDMRACEARVEEFLVTRKGNGG